MDEAILIPILALLIPVVLVPTVLVLRQLNNRREWKHLERMKALELGVPVPGTEEWQARTAIAIGAVMPVGVFLVACLSYAMTHAVEVWIPAALVGGLGVYSGVRLASRATMLGGGGHHVHLGQNGRVRDQNVAKPSFDPDDYDAIARLG